MLCLCHTPTLLFFFYFMFLNFPYILANIHEITNSPVKSVILSVVLCSRCVEAFWLAGCLSAGFPIQCLVCPGQVAVLMARRGLEADFGSWGYRSCAGGHTWLLSPLGSEAFCPAGFVLSESNAIEEKIISGSRCCGVELDASTPRHPEVWDHSAQKIKPQWPP